jgi:hypothetical protein
MTLPLLTAFVLSISAPPSTAQEFAPLPFGGGFVQNGGQWSDHVQYAAGVQGAGLALLEDGFQWTLRTGEDRLSLWFEWEESADPSGFWQPEEPLPGLHHYWVGSGPGVTGLRPYSSARMVAGENALQVEVRETKGWVLSTDSGGEVSFSLRGGTAKRLAPNGALVVEAAGVQYSVPAPRMGPGVQGLWTIRGDARVAVVPGGPVPAEAGGPSTTQYTDSPSIDWSTYLGAPDSADWGRGATYDSQGRPLACGRTDSEQFPTFAGPFLNPPGGVEDGYLTKLTGDASKLVFSTYLGGSKKDYLVAVDNASNDEIAIVARTNSSDWPVTPGAFDTTLDAVGSNYALAVSRLTADGSTPIFSTYFGSNTGDLVFRYFTIAKDDGTVLASGDTGGVPITPGNAFGNANWSAFLSKLSADGSELLFSCRPPCDAYMAELSDGSIVVYGDALDSNFSSMGGFQESFNGGMSDTWLGILNPEGSELLASTFLGGNAGEGGLGLDVDVLDNIYVCGTTQSPDFPQVASPFGGAPFPNAPGFIAKFDRTLSQPDWTALIGTDNSLVNYQTAWQGLVSDRSGITTVVGWATPAAPVDYPTAGAHNVVFPVFYNGRMMRLAPDGQRVLYSSAFEVDEPAQFPGIRVPAKAANPRVALLNGHTGTFFDEMLPTPGAFKECIQGVENCDVETYLTQFNFFHEGVQALGDGGQSCLGIISLNTTRRADVGADDFAFYVSQAPPSSVGVLLLGGSLALPLPIEGQTLWVDPTSLLPLQLFSTQETGYGVLDLVIPPAAAGKSFAAQAAILGTPECGEPGAFVVSEALTVTVP